MAKHISVVGAVITKDGRVLAAQRGPQGQLPGLWEFPGGKIEVGESPQDALTREIEEELGCRVVVGDVVTTTTHVYEFAVVTLSTFYCTLLTGQPESREHSSLRWLAVDELDDVEWAPADIPAVQVLQVALS